MGLKSILGDIALNRWKRRMEDSALSFPGALIKPKHVLICLPGELRELTMVKQFLPQIQEMFGESQISLLALPGVRVNDIYPRKGFNILSPSSDATGWSGLPKKSYLDQLNKRQFDLVLDMNLGSSPFTRGVLLSLPSAVRIGRGNHLGHPYYNLEIKTKYLRDERNIYKSLLTTLCRLKDSAQPNSAPSLN